MTELDGLPCLVGPFAPTGSRDLLAACGVHQVTAAPLTVRPMLTNCVMTCVEVLALSSGTRHAELSCALQCSGHWCVLRGFSGRCSFVLVRDVLLLLATPLDLPLTVARRHANCGRGSVPHMFFENCGYVCLTDVQHLLLRHLLFADECGMQRLPSSEPGATPSLAPRGAVVLGCARRAQQAMGLRAPRERAPPSFDSTGVAAGK